MLRKWLVSAIVVVAALTVACSHQRPKPEPTSPASGSAAHLDPVWTGLITWDWEERTPRFQDANGPASWEARFTEKAVFDLPGESDERLTSKAFVEHQADYLDVFRDPSRNNACTTVTATMKATGTAIVTLQFTKIDAHTWSARTDGGNTPLNKTTGSYLITHEPAACVQTSGPPVADVAYLRPLNFTFGLDATGRQSKGSAAITTGPTQQISTYDRPERTRTATVTWDLGYLPTECRRQTVGPTDLRTASQIAGQSDSFEKRYRQGSQAKAFRILRTPGEVQGLSATVEGVTSGFDPAIISPIYSRLESPFHLAAVTAHELDHALWNAQHGFDPADAAAVLTFDEWAALRRELEFSARRYATKVLEEIAQASPDFAPCRDRAIRKNPELWGPMSDQDRQREVAEAEDPATLRPLYDKARGSDPSAAERAHIESFRVTELPDIVQRWSAFQPP